MFQLSGFSCSSVRCTAANDKAKAAFPGKETREVTQNACFHNLGVLYKRVIGLVWD